MTVAVAQDTTLLMTRIFEAPAARVFDAWLTREKWQSWVGPPGTQCEIPLLEPHVGGRYRIDMRMSNGGPVIPVGGVFKVIDRPRKLVMTWCWDGDPARESLLTLLFRPSATARPSSRCARRAWPRFRIATTMAAGGRECSASSRPTLQATAKQPSWQCRALQAGAAPEKNGPVIAHRPV